MRGVAEINILTEILNEGVKIDDRVPTSGRRERFSADMCQKRSIYTLFLSNVRRPFRRPGCLCGDLGVLTRPLAGHNLKPVGKNGDGLGRENCNIA